MENILKCKNCHSIPRLQTWEVQEDDEGKYVVEKYDVICSNPVCSNQTDPHWTEDDAIEEWNSKYGIKGMSLEEIIELRGVEKPKYDRAGFPSDNPWYHYYNGWRDAYKDLKEILSDNGFDLNQIVIPSNEKELSHD